jgi:hypothetical protein
VETLFSTRNIHPRDRFDYWHSISSKNLVGHESRPECRETFAAELQVASLADIRLLLFENSPMDVWGPRATSDDLFVCRQFAGRLAISQNAHDAVLERGDITLLDPLLPYAGRFHFGSKLLVLKSAGCCRLAPATRATCSPVRSSR